jgi:signal transduction histidine kinase
VTSGRAAPEASLSALLVDRFSRVTRTTLAGYATLVVVTFTLFSEVQLTRSLDRMADAIQSLLGMYADPGGARTTVAPDMLASELVGVGARFVITRTKPGRDGMPVVYYLSPNMPAQRIEGATGASTPDAVHEAILSALAEQGWRYRVLHRKAGEFDLFLADSRLPNVLAVVALSLAAVFLLPAAAVMSRRATEHAVARAIQPLQTVRNETLDIGPDDLSRRVSAPSGIAEVTDIAETINRLIERVQRTQMALTSFTADASHELRTPLTHVRAQLQWALDDRRSSAEVRDALAAVGAEIEWTVRMIDDLLLLARGENRELAVARRPFGLAAIVDDVAEITQLMAADRPMTVTRSSAPDVEALGDPRYTRQILLNLASNAVRHAGGGEVSFDIVRGGERVGVTVRDTGDGIAPGHLPRLFERFYRVEPSRSREHGGAGLGLAIAQMLALLQNGEIMVESAPERGSAFTLWLMRADAEATEATRGG